MKSANEFKEELFRRRDKKLRSRKRAFTACTSMLLAVVLVLGFFLYPQDEKIKVHAVDLMENMNESAVEGTAPDDTFIHSQMDFSLKLFQACQTGDNSLISPLSVSLALAMTANGADGDTLADMETALGGLSIEDLNNYLKYYVNHLSSSEKAKLSIANSLWYNNNKAQFTPNRDFLQTLGAYYDADAYAAPFDDTTLEDINNWISHNTDGMIEDVLDRISPWDVMYLINTVLFDGEWETPYNEHQVREEIFTNSRGKEQPITMMFSTEHTYVEDENAIGFMKDYAEGYRFVALLPNEGMTVEEYVDTLTAESLLEMLENEDDRTVRAGLPKFEYESNYDLTKALTDLGMGSAFQRDANFSKMGTIDDGKLYLGSVIHKTKITVNEQRTKAAAVTITRVYGTGAMSPAEIVTVTLDRPFVYLIIDSETNLPLFMGTVTDLG